MSTILLLTMFTSMAFSKSQFSGARRPPSIASMKPSNKTTVSSNTTPPMSKSAELQNLIRTLEKNYKKDGVDGIQKELHHAWTKLMQGGQQHSSNEINELQDFLLKIVEDYNNGSAKKAPSNLDEEWNHYVKVFGKEYTEEEKEMRKAIFKKNNEHTEEHNSLFKQGKVSYSIKMNHFSDRTEEELRKMRGNIRTQNSTSPSHAHPKRVARQSEICTYVYDRRVSVPDSVDWRKRGYVTPVKYQGTCHACYAFAGIGALEAYHKKKTGNLISLSEQNILDCTWDLGNNGCEGGFFPLVFVYAQLMGVMSEEHYPYTMNASYNCRWKKEHAIATDEGFLAIPAGDEIALKHAVATHGPVSVSISTTEDFVAYSRGIFHPPNMCKVVDHGVVIVGYGTHPVHGDYWIGKNSYGNMWGEDGYVLLPRNKNNVCDVASFAVLPN